MRLEVQQLERRSGRSTSPAHRAGQPNTIRHRVRRAVLPYLYDLGRWLYQRGTETMLVRDESGQMLGFRRVTSVRLLGGHGEYVVDVTDLVETPTAMVVRRRRWWQVWR